MTPESAKPCPTCKGEGEIEGIFADEDGNAISRVVCPACHDLPENRAAMLPESAKPEEKRPSCMCCGKDAPIRGEGDPWDGRLDGYCENCSEARCDAFPGAHRELDKLPPVSDGKSPERCPEAQPVEQGPLVRQARAYGDEWLAQGIEELTRERDAANRQRDRAIVLSDSDAYTPASQYCREKARREKSEARLLAAESLITETVKALEQIADATSEVSERNLVGLATANELARSCATKLKGDT